MSSLFVKNCESIHDEQGTTNREIVAKHLDMGILAYVLSSSNNMEIRNCTSLVLNIIKQDGEVLDIPPCGIVPRCSQSEECVLVINDIALTRQTFGEVIDLPEPQKDVLLVVSRLVASSCPDRYDLLVPGPLVRDSEGKVIGCRGLSII